MRRNKSELAPCGLHTNDEGETLSSSKTPEIHQRTLRRLPSSLCKPSLRAYFDWEDRWNDNYAKRPKLLDLFSGAGGAAVGYYLAGFNITGIDNRPMPRYPFKFIQADALEYLEAHGDEYDVIHASPPCQAFTNARVIHGKEHPDILTPTRELLRSRSKPYIIENVPGAPMRADFVLCGSMFGESRLKRHRCFEMEGFGFSLVRCCNHGKQIISVFGHGGHIYHRVAEWREVMGIDWMTRDELAQAIPPAYTEWIGKRIMEKLIDG